MENAISYIQVGDFLLPNIILPEPPGADIPLGRYAHMRKAFLKEHRTAFYNTLLLSGKLWPHLQEIDKTAGERRERGVSEEVILSELVYD